MGARIHEDILSNPELGNRGVYIFKKGTDPEVDSYSGFFDNDPSRSVSTGLDIFLKDRGIENLFVVGLATDYCVFWTCQDAVELGYKTYVVVNGTRVIDENWSLTNFGQAGVELTSSSLVPKTLKNN